ncbi:MAG TPA: 50S ribosomal protein L25 [Candidatus Saccharimonadales bacterium]|nr:50S ribosomal protein L25 [Candidatus Saccharimonadales bacterium]
MQETTILTLEERTATGSRAARKMRTNGFVPAVVYGHNLDSQTLQAPYTDIAKAYHKVGKHSPIELHIGDKKRLAMVKRVDIEPVKRKLQHIAFYIVKQNEKVQTEVSIHLIGEGESAAEKAGLVLIKNVDTVQIEAFPRDLPEFLELSIVDLTDAGDHRTVGDIVAPEGVTILSDTAQQIVSAVEPAALAAANDAAGGDAEDESEVAAEHGAEEGEESSEKTEGEAAKKD